MRRSSAVRYWLRELSASFCSEVLVARAQRETVGLAHGGRADDLDRQTQIGSEPADDRELLIVLLAEHRDVGLNDVEQLRHDRGDAFEVPGTELAAQNLRKPRHLHARRVLVARRVDLRDVGHEHEIAARGLEHALVLARRTRVMREVLVRSELHRIDEDARDEAVSAAPRDLHETEMTRVEIPHRGDEGDAFARTPPCAHALSNRRDRGHGVHARLLSVRSSAREPGTRPTSPPARSV